MALVVNDAFVAQDILVQQFLQLEQRGRLVPAYIAEVVGSAAAHGQGPWIFVLLDMHLIKCGVIVVLDAKGHGPQQFVMLYEFDITDGMDFFAPADHFIGAVIINKFQQV